MGLIHRSRRSSGVGNGNLFQYSCLENSMGREAWWATVHRLTRSQTQLSTAQHTQRKDRCGKEAETGIMLP